MNKKCDSVQQIIDTCSKLVTEGEESECVDVQSLTKTVKEECSILSTIFEEDPSNTQRINIQKSVVESAAIRLEFFLRVRHNSYVEQNKMREFAEKLYMDCRALTIELSRDKDVNPIEFNEWGVRTRWALDFFARSKHILFEVDNEDELQIKSITIAMERLRGKSNG